MLVGVHFLKFCHVHKIIKWNTLRVYRDPSSLRIFVTAVASELSNRFSCDFFRNIWHPTWGTSSAVLSQSDCHVERGPDLESLVPGT